MGITWLLPGTTISNTGMIPDVQVPIQVPAFLIWYVCVYMSYNISMYYTEILRKHHGCTIYIPTNIKMHSGSFILYATAWPCTLVHPLFPFQGQEQRPLEACLLSGFKCSLIWFYFKSPLPAFGKLHLYFVNSVRRGKKNRRSSRRWCPKA